MTRQLAKPKKWHEREQRRREKLSYNPRELGYDDLFEQMRIKKRMLSTASKRARQEGVTFDLTDDDLDIPRRCPYLNTPFTFIVGTGRIEPLNPSIDRIIPERGYVRGNVHVISVLANRMKSNATAPQLVAFALGVLRLHIEPGNVAALVKPAFVPPPEKPRASGNWRDVITPSGNDEDEE